MTRRLPLHGLDTTGASEGNMPQIVGGVPTWAPPPAGGGSGGGGAGAAPVVATRTSGSFTLPSGGYTDVTATMDLAVAAAAGDWIEVGLSSGYNGGGNKSLDMVTRVAGAVVNYISGAGSAGLGVQAWTSTSTGVTPLGGSVFYQVQAGDIEAGTVTFRLRSKTASGGTLFAQTDRPLHLWARNVTAGGDTTGLDGGSL